MTDRYEDALDALAHEIWVVAQLAPGEGILDGVARIVSLLRREAYPAITELQARNAAGVEAAADDGWHVADCDTGPSYTEEGKETSND